VSFPASPSVQPVSLMLTHAEMRMSGEVEGRLGPRPDVRSGVHGLGAQCIGTQMLRHSD
jgi:hypothetical protein